MCRLGHPQGREQVWLLIRTSLEDQQGGVGRTCPVPLHGSWCGLGTCPCLSQALEPSATSCVPLATVAMVTHWGQEPEGRTQKLAPLTHSLTQAVT